jgi:inosine-uridine nucleoside N-ribohydrolase
MRRVKKRVAWIVACGMAVGCWCGAGAQGKRKVIIDQDAMGPATTDQQAILLVLQAPDVETLGITVVTGDQWRDEEVAHTLRMLELTGYTSIPVVPGAVLPLINTKEETARREKLYGTVPYQGAWNWGPQHAANEVPPLKEGMPSLKPAQEDAAHFIVRMVHTYPHEVSLLTAGPLTNIALAIALDPEVPSLAKELVFNGGRINPQGIPYEQQKYGTMEFNLWFDPEASHIVLRAPWKAITCSPVDVTNKVMMEKTLILRIAKGSSPAAQYVANYAVDMPLWDELTFAAWLDPSVITESHSYFLDVDINHGASYGSTLVWFPGTNPGLGERPVTVNLDVNVQKFYDEFVTLLTSPPKVQSERRGDSKIDP